VFSILRPFQLRQIKGFLRGALVSTLRKVKQFFFLHLPIFMFLYYIIIFIRLAPVLLLQSRRKEIRAVERDVSTDSTALITFLVKP
jgi:hypothetical protein